jgi:outer membrane protein assembly factor BamB
MRWRVLLCVIGATLLAPVSPAASAGAAGWTTYRHDAARSGVDPDSASPVTPSQAWQTPPLDGQVYAQPLVYGSHVFLATENDTVYELDAATGAAVWATHLATPENSSVAPCGDIGPSIGITSTPVIDPSTGRIYAVGAVTASDNTVHHELFALDLSSGQPIAGFPIPVDPPFPSGGSPVNQLQRAGLALDGGRVLIGYGGNDDDCATYWGWLVSAPTDGSTGLSSFQVDAGHRAGAIWASGNAPAIDAAGNAFVATGNGIGNSTSDPNYGDSVVKLNAFASPLDWWAPANWQTLDTTDADLGSSMPTLLPGGFVFQTGKDGNGYLLNGAGLGSVGSAVATVSGFCPGGSFGGSVHDSADSAIYVACAGGLRARSLALGSATPLAPKTGFSAPRGATGPPMIAGGLVWATDSSGTLYGLDPISGAARSQFSIPESGSQVNHFASPSAGGGLLFVGSGDQVTAFTIAQPPPGSTTVQQPGPTTSGPPPGSAGAGPASSGGGGPAISAASIAPRHFRATRAVTLRLTLSEAAAITVAATQLHQGRIVRRRCSMKARLGKRCAVRLTFVKLRHKGGAGRNAFKVRFRRLAAGHYTALIYATDSSGRRSAVIRIGFTILPEPSSAIRKSSLRSAGASLTALATSVALGADRSPG